MNLRITSIFNFALVLLSTLSLSAIGFSQDDDELDWGEQGVRSHRDVTPIVVRSNDSQTARILEAAFSIHGGYQIVDSMAAASFGVRVDPVGNAGAKLVITSGSPESTLFTETQPGRSLREATLKAVDRAIFKTSGKPGFFSGKLAYISEESGATEVYTSDMLFGNTLKWTSDYKDAMRPRWSPDGNSIVYTSYKNGYPDVHRLDLRNNRRDVIVDFKGTNIGARFSPDGNRMAVIITGGNNADLWVREPTGQLRNLTKSSGLEAAPSWSPDGSRIVYSSDQNGGVQLFMIPSQGGSPRRVRTDISGYCAEPDWNQADPTKIAFTAAFGSGYQICVYDTQARKSRQVTSERGDAIEAHWLNDGRHIVYTHRRANNKQIKIVDTLTGRTAVLSGSKTSVSQASFLAP